jgi:6-phosphogluconate dehydrogenase (decarboxylating)
MRIGMIGLGKMGGNMTIRPKTNPLSAIICSELNGPGTMVGPA